MKWVILSAAFVLLGSAAVAFQLEDTRYVKASIQISGEFTADATITLQVGKPAKMVWEDEGGSDYVLMIPDVSATNGIPNVFGMLLKETDGRWEVVTEANSLGDQRSLLGLSPGNAILSISASFVPKSEVQGSGQGQFCCKDDDGEGCCSARCTDGSGRTLQCCGGCCSDGVCGAQCCP